MTVLVACRNCHKTFQCDSYAQQRVFCDMCHGLAKVCDGCNETKIVKESNGCYQWGKCSLNHCNHCPFTCYNCDKFYCQDCSEEKYCEGKERKGAYCHDCVESCYQCARCFATLCVSLFSRSNSSELGKLWSHCQKCDQRLCRSCTKDHSKGWCHACETGGCWTKLTRCSVWGCKRKICEDCSQFCAAQGGKPHANCWGMNICRACQSSMKSCRQCDDEYCNPCRWKYMLKGKCRKH